MEEDPGDSEKRSKRPEREREKTRKGDANKGKSLKLAHYVPFGGHFPNWLCLHLLAFISCKLDSKIIAQGHLFQLR